MVNLIDNSINYTFEQIPHSYNFLDLVVWIFSCKSRPLFQPNVCDYIQFVSLNYITICYRYH